MVYQQRDPTFAEYVRQEQLSTRGIILAWLESHKCVAPRQLAVETDNYYNGAAFRTMVHVMAQATQLIQISWGVYVKGPGGPSREAFRLPVSIKLEIGLLAQAMPSREVAKLYDINRRTVEKYSHEYQRSHTSRSIQG